MRSEDHVLWDKVAVLALLDAVNRVGKMDGNLKIQKLVFLYELQAQRAGHKGGHYRFFRYQYGPYSADLANDVTDLERMNCITKTARTISKRGRFILDYVGALSGAVAWINAVARDYGRMTGPRLTDRVYAMTVPVADLGREELVRDIPMFLDILDPLHAPDLADMRLPDEVSQDIRDEFAIPPERLEPSDPSFQRTIRMALDRIPA